MSYKMLKKEVDLLVDRELDRANRENRHFHSDHEGESVIREEWTEAEAEVIFCRQWLDEITRAVFQDDPGSADLNAEELHKQAIYLACEAIQLAAMARKFTESRQGRRMEPAEAEEPAGPDASRIILRPSCRTCAHYMSGHKECLSCDDTNNKWVMKTL